MADPKEDGMKISFSFSKKKTSTVLDKNVHIPSAVGGNDQETDFVHALEGREVKSNKPKEKEKPLVIPLIKRNAYGSHGSQQSDERKTAEDGSQILNTSADNLDDDAIKEIIQDAARYNEEWKGRGSEDVNLTIPLLMQNRAPEGTETDEKLDVSIRPDGASAADYDQVPIEQFGMAMLRGMGWKEHEGIGAKMKK